MRRISTLVAALAIGFAASSAQALILPVDDFSAPSMTLFDPTGNAGGGVSSGLIAGGGFSRTITHELLQPGNPNSTCVDSCVRMGGATFPPGRLVMSNTDNNDSEVTVSWALLAGFVPLGSPVSFFFDVINSDGNPINTDIYINNVLVAGFVIPSNSLNITRTFGLTLGQQATLNAGGVLQLRVNGVEGWDMTLDTVGFNIPEPTTLALVGLALLGAGVVSRRRKV